MSTPSCYAQIGAWGDENAKGLYYNFGGIKATMTTPIAGTPSKCNMTLNRGTTKCCIQANDNSNIEVGWVYDKTAPYPYNQQPYCYFQNSRGVLSYYKAHGWNQSHTYELATIAVDDPAGQHWFTTPVIHAKVDGKLIGFDFNPLPVVSNPATSPYWLLLIEFAALGIFDGLTWALYRRAPSIAAGFDQCLNMVKAFNTRSLTIRNVFSYATSTLSIQKQMALEEAYWLNTYKNAVKATMDAQSWLSESERVMRMNKLSLSDLGNTQEAITKLFNWSEREANLNALGQATHRTSIHPEMDAMLLNYKTALERVAYLQSLSYWKTGLPNFWNTTTGIRDALIWANYLTTNPSSVRYNVGVRHWNQTAWYIGLRQNVQTDKAYCHITGCQLARFYPLMKSGTGKYWHWENWNITSLNRVRYSTYLRLSMHSNWYDWTAYDRITGNY